jgi:NAD(P)-dependent dehydrogenase (short-subunit alcohol dehydrogenase family)
MSKKIDARRIVITGVSRGLGRALVDELIAAGHTVLGCARSEGRVAELARRYPAPHDFAVVDVTDDTAVKAWAARICTAGAPDLLINNAAIMNGPAPLWQVPADEFSAIVNVNIKGVANTIRHFVPAMIARGRGVIVNFSSGWGRSVSPDVAPYCATKWAIEGLTQALAEELPEGMAAVPLNPGIINTEMLQTCWGEEAKSYTDPADWAKRAAPFLLKLGRKDNGHPRSVPR